MSGGHTGLVIDADKYLHSIYLGTSRKYDRYMAITYLPKTKNMDACVGVGNLEVSKEGDGKEFYNPCKFYNAELLFEAAIHMLALYIAFSCLKRGVTLTQKFIPLMRRFTDDKELHKKIMQLSENYYEEMVRLESKYGAK